MNDEKKVLGRVIVKDAGFVNVKDRTTYEIAKMYFRILGQLMRERKKE